MAGVTNVNSQVVEFLSQTQVLPDWLIDLSANKFLLSMKEKTSGCMWNRLSQNQENPVF